MKKEGGVYGKKLTIYGIFTWKIRYEGESLLKNNNAEFRHEDNILKFPYFFARSVVESSMFRPYLSISSRLIGKNTLPS